MELLPCPLCGSDDVELVSDMSPGSFAACRGVNCGALGPSRETDEYSVTAWNRRAPDPALLALARLGAWLAQSYAEESGGFDGPEIEDAEDRFGVVVLVKAAPGTCAGGKQYGDTCPCAEYYGSDEERECRLLAPGIADAIARLLAPDGAGEVTDGD